MKDIVELVEKVRGNIGAIAEAYKTKNIDKDILEDVGVTSLYENYHKYDPDKAKFQTFASVCARAAMIDYIRKYTSTANSSERVEPTIVSMEDQNEFGVPIKDTLIAPKQNTLEDEELSELVASLVNNVYNDYEDYYIITRTFGLIGNVQMSAQAIIEELGIHSRQYNSRLNRMLKILRGNEELASLFNK